MHGNASKESGYSFTVNVADVTGDDDADFISTPAAASGFADSLFTDYNNQAVVARGMEAEDAKRRILDQAGVCDKALFPGKNFRAIENSEGIQDLERQLDSLLSE